MSLGHGPSISRNGLTLYLDAANKKSYPGTGTTWYDISGNNRNFTLTNGPAYNTANSGYITFDGVDDTSTVAGNPRLASSAISISAWVRCSAHGTGGYTIIRNNWIGNGWILYVTATRWSFGIGQSTVAYQAQEPTNNSTSWTHLYGVYDGTNVLLYVNGVLGSITSSVTLAGILANTSTIIGNGANVGVLDIGSIMVNSTAISELDVKRYFEATRGRYGI